VINVHDPGGRYRRATATERGRFFEALSAAGIGFVRRYSGGPDIRAACGMLASSAGYSSSHMESGSPSSG